jgi:putative oxidoreductase
MSHVQPSSGQAEPARRGVDAGFLWLFADPLVLLARAMLAYIFIAEGFGKIANYADVQGYMRDHGVAPALLPLVILTELGGGLLVLFGLKTRWAAIALAGFCVLTALLFHLPTGEMVEVQKNIAIAGGFLLLARFGPGAWSIDGRLAGAGNGSI